MKRKLSLIFVVLLAAVMAGAQTIDPVLGQDQGSGEITEPAWSPPQEVKPDCDPPEIKSPTTPAAIDREIKRCEDEKKQVYNDLPIAHTSAQADAARAEIAALNAKIASLQSLRATVDGHTREIADMKKSNEYRDKRLGWLSDRVGQVKDTADSAFKQLAGEDGLMNTEDDTLVLINSKSNDTFGKLAGEDGQMDTDDDTLTVFRRRIDSVPSWEGVLLVALLVLLISFIVSLFTRNRAVDKGPAIRDAVRNGINEMREGLLAEVQTMVNQAAAGFTRTEEPAAPGAADSFVIVEESSAPTITQVEPKTGKPGDERWLDGSNYHPDSTIEFYHGVAAWHITTKTFISPNEIKFTVPPKPNGETIIMVGVRVTNPDGQKIEVPDAFTYEE